LFNLGSCQVIIHPVVQLCPTLCHPMNYNTLGFRVHHQLSELVQTPVRVDEAIQPSHPVIPFSSCLQSCPASGSFPMSQFFASGGQSIAVSASASILPVNIQNWFFFFWITVLFLIYVQFCQIIFLHLLKCSYGCFSP